MRKHLNKEMKKIVKYRCISTYSEKLLWLNSLAMHYFIYLFFTKRMSISMNGGANNKIM